MVIDSDSISKVLVRMPSEVKSRATDAAHRAGTSLNSWTVSVLDRAVSNLRERQKRGEERQDPGETAPEVDPPKEPGPRE